MGGRISNPKLLWLFFAIWFWLFECAVLAFEPALPWGYRWRCARRSPSTRRGGCSLRRSQDWPQAGARRKWPSNSINTRRAGCSRSVRWGRHQRQPGPGGLRRAVSDTYNAITDVVKARRHHGAERPSRTPWKRRLLPPVAAWRSNRRKARAALDEALQRGFQTMCRRASSSNLHRGRDAQTCGHPTWRHDFRQPEGRGLCLRCSTPCANCMADDYKVEGTQINIKLVTMRVDVFCSTLVTDGRVAWQFDRGSSTFGWIGGLDELVGSR